MGENTSLYYCNMLGPLRWGCFMSTIKKSAPKIKLDFKASILNCFLNILLEQGGSRWHMLNIGKLN
jgi:hypothetical protein